MTALAWVASALARTWRIECEGDGELRRVRAAGVPVVFAVWHGSLIPPLWQRRHEGIALLVSAHRDGGYLADAAVRWGYRVFRGSSTRGGAAGLRRIVRALRAGNDAAFAVDGPRGPAGVAKPGPVTAARLADAAVVPVGAEAERGWRLASWDRMQVPGPGARVRIVYGYPLLDGWAGEEVALRRLSHAVHDAQRRASW